MTVTEGNKVLQNYMNTKYIAYSESYDLMFKVIEKLEKEDLSLYMYSWQEHDLMRYNFEGIFVDKYEDSWDIYIKLALDPSMQLCNDIDASLPLKEQLFESLVAAVRKINEIKTR